MGPELNGKVSTPCKSVIGLGLGRVASACLVIRK